MVALVKTLQKIEFSHKEASMEECAEMNIIPKNGCWLKIPIIFSSFSNGVGAN
jgi:hypothetical protein